MSADLRALIERWREFAEFEVTNANNRSAAALYQCADELEAALSSPRKEKEDASLLGSTAGESRGEPEASSWQPIETAPKDSSLIMLYGRFIDGSSGPPCRCIGIWFQGYADRGWWTVAALPFEPTHWMSLPDPPAAAPSREPQP